MGLVKSVSNYLNAPIRPSLLTRLLTRSRRHSSSSTPTPDNGFIQFWDQGATTGIMKLRELLCAKHKLQVWSSKYGVWAFICANCEARFYVLEEDFRKAWTREDPVEVQPRIQLGWQTPPEQRYDFELGDSKGYTGGLGILGLPD